MTQKSPYVHLKHKWIHSNQFSITYKYPSVCLFSSINKYSPKHYQQHTSEATLCQSLASIHPKRSRGNITHKSPYIYNKQTRQITCNHLRGHCLSIGPCDLEVGSLIWWHGDAHIPQSWPTNGIVHCHHELKTECPAICLHFHFSLKIHTSMSKKKVHLEKMF